MIDFSISNKLTDDVIINNDLLHVLQQIDLLFDTEPGTVLGADGFGSNYDRYLYNIRMSPRDLEQHILSDIRDKIDLRNFTVNVYVSMIEGTVRDIAIIEIILSGNYETYSTSYVIK
jgi:hypothetical protein